MVAAGGSRAHEQRSGMAPPRPSAPVWSTDAPVKERTKDLPRAMVASAGWRHYFLQYEAKPNRSWQVEPCGHKDGFSVQPRTEQYLSRGRHTGKSGPQSI